ncbi:MAG: class I SAM-dependent methyltransferase [Ginsengibacter sp.]
MKNIKDDQGNNQIWGDSYATRIRSQRRYELFVDGIRGKGNHILEIGCGTGSMSYWIAQKTGANVLGTDICVPFIEQAKKEYQLPNLSYEVLDFNNAEKMMGRKFDCIIGNGILHHLYYQLDEVLLQFKELLNEHGKIIFMEPNIYNPYCTAIFKIPALRKAANLEDDEMAFSAPFILRKLTQTGFIKCRVAYKDFLLPGIPSFLVKPSVFIGNIAERLPLVKCLSQSIFIEASKD